MKNYTLMNLIQSATGYYYKSPQRFEEYINAKILFKQLHFKDSNSLLNEELTNIREGCNTLRADYSNHINSLNRVYLCFIIMTLIAVTYLSISNYFTDGGILIFIVKNSLSILVIPTLLLLWGMGYRKAGKGQRLVKRINIYENFLQEHSKPMIELEHGAPLDNVKTNDNVINNCLYICSILEEMGFIYPKDINSSLYAEYINITSQSCTYSLPLEIKNKKDYINTLTTLIVSRKAEGRKGEKSKNIFGVFVSNVGNKELNEFLSENLLLVGSSNNISYLIELSRGYNRTFAEVCKDLEQINAAYLNTSVNEYFKIKEQINN